MVVGLLAEQAALGCFVIGRYWCIIRRFRFVASAWPTRVGCNAMPVATTMDVVRMERDLQMEMPVICWSGRL